MIAPAGGRPGAGLRRLRGWLARAPVARGQALTGRLSMPLATAFVGSLAMAGLVVDVVAGGEPPAPGPARTAPASSVAAAPVAAPEPAAGPAAETLPETLPEAANLSSTRSSSLPEIPDTPASLDDVARELGRRREEILELEAALALREAAVRAAEADLEAQLRRLEEFRHELELLVGQAEAEEKERLAQLVKMYESMRAKAAAAIFDRLEMPVVLAVAKRMREAKMAAILAAMDPNRARAVTAELAREQELPRLRQE